MNAHGDSKRSKTGSTVGVVGAGSWGTCIAHHAALGGPAILWSRRDEFAARVQDQRENRDYLPGVRLADELVVTSDLSRCLEQADLIVLAVPTQQLRATLERQPAKDWCAAPLVVASKGIEISSHKLPTQMFAELLGERAAARAVIFSGPSFADEMARGQPTAIVAASTDATSARAVQARLSHGQVRVYTSSDALGVQTCAALKNVVAIAAGVADGLGFGANARAALITRSLAEISRLGVAMGADPATFMGLAGVGDLVLTCTGAQSRNRTVGFRLGKGEKLPDILASMTMVAEGVPTARAARELASERGVELPIVDQVAAILFESRDPRQALGELLARPLRSEAEPHG